MALLRRYHIVTHKVAQHPEDGDQNGNKEEDGLEGVGHNEGFEGLHLRAKVPGHTLDSVLRILVSGLPGSCVFHGGEDAR